MRTASRPRAASRWTLSVLLVVVAAVHLDLYFGAGYRFIPVIGWLFLLTSASALLLTLSVALRPRPVVVVVAGLFCVGVLGGYVLSLSLPDGIFQFRETTVSAAGYVSIVAESGVAVLAGLWLASARPQPDRSTRLLLRTRRAR